MNVPTLLAEGNLPALTKSCSASYDLYTRFADVEKIEVSQGFRSLSNLMPVHIHVISEDIIDDPIKAHRDLWFGAVDKAKQDQSSVLLMPPDVAWSDGSMGHIGNLLAQGKKVIYNFYLRVVSDTFMAEFFKQFANRDGAISIPPRKLVEFFNASRPSVDGSLFSR